MFQTMKKVYWDLRHRKNRFEYINSLITNIPGELGFSIRSSIVPKYFASAGKNIAIHTGVRYRGAQHIVAGDHVHFGIDNFLQASAGLEIGDHVLLGPGVKIWTINHKFQDTSVPILDQGYERKKVVICSNVWIGANAFIMPGVELPEGCIVSAGAVVGVKQFKPYSLIAGNPARVIGNRKSTQPKD